MARSFFARLARRFRPRWESATRREFLQASLAASAGLLLSNQPGLAQAGQQRRVVVVGAGFAGLACGYELKSAGYRVTVVEARNRVGGRVLSFNDFVPGKNVEGGAELIGSNHPSWVAYADKFKLKFLHLTAHEELAMPVRLLGRLLGDDEIENLYEEMDASFHSLNKLAEPIDADQPWRSPDAAKLDALNLAGWVQKLEVSDLARRAIDVQLASDNAVDNDKASFLAMLTAIRGGGLDKYWTESEVYRCRGGNQLLATKLAQEIGAESLHLGLPIDAIHVGDDQVAVTCADGRTLEADDVVLAVPPSVWPKLKISPELPEKLRTQMGVACKYEVAFKKRFWLDHKRAPDALTDGDVSQVWELTDGQPDQPPEAALVAFSGGSQASRCLARKGEARDAAYQAELEQLYPGHGEHVLKIRMMDWPNDPWTQGGYSFPAPGQVTAIGPTYYRGLGRLHFAGEHTCYKFAGYMEGALNSGISLARRIAQRDGLLPG